MLRNRLAQMFYGRNGPDSFARFALIFSLALAFLNLFIHSLSLYVLGILALGYAFFRMFSKNRTRRAEENAVYVRWREKTRQFFTRQLNRIRYHSTKAYRRCPHCGAHLCLPRKKGKHTVKCPSCEQRFDVKI